MDGIYKIENLYRTEGILHVHHLLSHMRVRINLLLAQVHWRLVRRRPWDRLL